MNSEPPPSGPSCNADQHAQSAALPVKDRGSGVTVLVIASPDCSCALLDEMRHEGSLGPQCTVIDGGSCHDLVRQFDACAPNQIVVFAPAFALAEAISTWAGHIPCAITWVSSDVQADDLARLCGLGLTGWWPDAGLRLHELALALSLDRLRWQREAALRAELSQVRTQLDDRKWVDRAKGILAQARGLNEDEAFKLLRGASMHANLKIGEVSKSVIEASAWAEALNLSGQLRMLSQRVVKLAAQRLAGVDAHRAHKQQEEAEQRAQNNLDVLCALPQLASADPALQLALAQTQAAWSALKGVLQQKRSPAALRSADETAGQLLAQAELLVKRFEAASNRRALNVVNLCGRQRMLAQRLCKDALLAELLSDADRRAGLAALTAEFESALAELEQAPLSNPEIRNALTAARDEWRTLLYGLRHAENPESRLTLSRSSDALLEVFEKLTGLYEKSMQVIMS